MDNNGMIRYYFDVGREKNIKQIGFDRVDNPPMPKTGPLLTI